MHAMYFSNATVLRTTNQDEPAKNIIQQPQRSTTMQTDKDQNINRKGTKNTKDIKNTLII
jgi:hypothetical protein